MNTSIHAPHLPIADPTRSAVASHVAVASGIRFDAVSVTYGDSTVLDALNLNIAPGKIVALIGPSGSGKTTALRAVAGFATPSKGRITIDGRDITHVPPSERDIGMVVQNYALFPHMRVEDNVAFGLRARKASAERIRTQVTECLRLVGMSAYAKRYPRELSGGQQQRVAIARALAIQPKVLLLDEPLSALDAQIRRSMLDELAKLHRDLPDLTVLYVTHDQNEALILADHIGIMRDGKLVAFGSAQGLYRHPPNQFAAEFLGRANVLTVQALQHTQGEFSAARFRDGWIHGRNHHALQEGAACLICVRPHEMTLVRGADTDNVVTGFVRSAVWLGEMHSIEIDVDGQRIRMNVPPMMEPPATGTTLSMYFDPAQATFIPASDSHA